MSDGTLSVRRRDPKASEAAADMGMGTDAARSGTFESFLGGMLPTIGERKLRQNIKGKSKKLDNVDEFRVESRRKKRLREYDRLLKSFKYGAALDSVLAKVCAYSSICLVIQINGALYSKDPQQPNFH